METIELTHLETELIVCCLRNRLANLTSPNIPNFAKEEIAVITALLNKLGYVASIKAVGTTQANR
jgi:hypothetical protein